MKKSELRKIIREVLSESPNAASNEDLKAITKLGFGFKGKVTGPASNWIQGKAKLRNDFETSPDVEVHIIRSDNPEKRGIENGRILKLWIAPKIGIGYVDTDPLVYYHDSKWIARPREPEVKKFVAQLVKALS
jgi:hypothetical protein